MVVMEIFMPLMVAGPSPHRCLVVKIMVVNLVDNLGSFLSSCLMQLDSESLLPTTISSLSACNQGNHSVVKLCG